MARLSPGIDYAADLASIRSKYVSATLRQRLSIIRQRLEDHHFGANRLVTSVSAVEALARSLLMHREVRRKSDFSAEYPKYKRQSPEQLIKKYLALRGISDVKSYFAEDTWELFGYAVEYRNLLAHECTYLGIQKFPSLIEACEDVLTALVKQGRIREPSA